MWARVGGRPLFSPTQMYLRQRDPYAAAAAFFAYIDKYARTPDTLTQCSQHTHTHASHARITHTTHAMLATNTHTHHTHNSRTCMIKPTLARITFAKEIAALSVSVKLSGKNSGI